MIRPVFLVLCVAAFVILSGGIGCGGSTSSLGCNAGDVGCATSTPLPVCDAGNAGCASSTPLPVCDAGDGLTAPIRIVSNQEYMNTMAVSDGRLYWNVSWPSTDGGPYRQAAMTAATTACDATPSVFAEADDIYAIVLGADRVYWSGSGATWSKPKSGGNATLFSASCAQVLFVDETDAFCSSPGPYTPAMGTWYGRILRVDLASGAVTEIFAEQSLNVVGLTADAANVYFSSGTKVRRVPRSGGTAVDIATDQVNPASVAVDSERVYWVNAGHTRVVDMWLGDGSIMSALLGGGTPRVLGENFAGLVSMAIDSTFIFASGSPITTDHTPLVRVPLDGSGTAVIMVPSVGSLSARLATNQMAIDASNVYFMDIYGSVYRVAKTYSAQP